MAWFNIIAILLLQAGIAGIEGLRNNRKRSCFKKILGVKCPYLEYDR
jgi:hypothetical protein